MPPEPSSNANPWLLSVLSFLVPGSGQFLVGQRARGFVLFLTFFLLLGLVLWSSAFALLAIIRKRKEQPIGGWCTKAA